MTYRSLDSRCVEYLLQTLPPSRLPSQAALRALHERLLVAISHPPPLLDLGVVRHLLHVACPVVTNVFEGREENVGCRVIKDGVWKTGISINVCYRGTRVATEAPHLRHGFG